MIAQKKAQRHGAVGNQVTETIEGKGRDWGNQSKIEKISHNSSFNR